MNERDRILGMLARGEDMGEAEIARELGTDTQGMTATMTELQRDGDVTRTAGGKWRLSTAAQGTTEPAPHPSEPGQDPASRE